MRLEQRREGRAILISGRGSNMMALVEAAERPDCPYEVVLVASNKPEAPRPGPCARDGHRDLRA